MPSGNCLISAHVPGPGRQVHTPDRAASGPSSSTTDTSSRHFSIPYHHRFKQTHTTRRPSCCQHESTHSACTTTCSFPVAQPRTQPAATPQQWPHPLQQWPADLQLPDHILKQCRFPLTSRQPSGCRQLASTAFIVVLAQQHSRQLAAHLQGSTQQQRDNSGTVLTQASHPQHTLPVPLSSCSTAWQLLWQLLWQQAGSNHPKHSSLVCDPSCCTPTLTPSSAATARARQSAALSKRPSCV